MPATLTHGATDLGRNLSGHQTEREDASVRPIALGELVTHTLDVVPLTPAAPLWLGLLTIFVNAIVGASRAHSDSSKPWDFVGITVFALLMGLGGGFIRDMLIGNLPAESLRSPWAVVTVVVAALIVFVVGPVGDRHGVLLDPLNAVALGLFAVTGAAYALQLHLPFSTAVLVGTASAVGGGMLCSVVQGQVPDVMLASAPNALLAALGAAAYSLGQALGASVVAASISGVAVVVVAQYLSGWRGLATRPASDYRNDPQDAHSSSEHRGEELDKGMDA